MKIPKWLKTTFGVLFAIAFILSSSYKMYQKFHKNSSFSKEISIVKKGSINACPNYTVEELVNNFMDKPKWEHIVADNGIDYVNISGIIMFYGKPAKGMLQFWLRNGDFGFQAFEIEEEPQNENMASVLIIEMCKSAKVEEKPKAGDKKNKTVKIGEQIWMAENLDIETGNSVCYENKENNCKKYGRLYDWKTAMKACPGGWHLPTDKEWKKLIAFSGGAKKAGKKLKEKTGFSALFGGSFNSSDAGGFYGADNFGQWWSASKGDYEAYFVSISNDSEDVSGDYEDMSSFLSIRCLQD
jgi:uncharacterized protein (TIGR02145 family)